jgi:hypothetical protein
MPFDLKKKYIVCCKMKFSLQLKMSLVAFQSDSDILCLFFI